MAARARAKTRTVYKYRYRNRPVKRRNNPAPRRRPRSTAIGKAKVAAMTTAHTAVAVGVAGAFGAMEARKVSVPKIDKLGVEGTWGPALWAAGVLFEEDYLKYAGTGLLAIAINQGAKEWFAEKPAATPATKGYPEVDDETPGTTYKGTG